ncbi:MAG: hypothetical protein GY951_04155 [Psychromonas sp.]|nr:hypothetical protein [Alteromonadales bacterium]MCP5077234.1 hypothetical protein [Psychromonas sp.]
MKPQIINDIYLIREVLESFDKSDFDHHSSCYHSSTGFPLGCCADTTHLLGLFLKQRYNKSSQYVTAYGLGDRENQSHTWLICDEFIIDITADQFNNKGYDVMKVIVEKESLFHRLFDRVDCCTLNTESLEGTPVVSVLNKVISKMEDIE